MNDFRLLMLSAMYENGGNVTHRFLDGHPQMFVYPFESQLGTKLVNDYLSSMFPVKYRWPVFDLGATAEIDYQAIIDEEVKVRARTSHVSKFRHVAFDFSDDARRESYVEYVTTGGRSRAHNVASFFRATFDAWKDYRRSGSEAIYVGYSPIVIVDAKKILKDFPTAHILHVVRNPWSAYADTKKRAVPLSLAHYLLGWSVNQQQALFFQKLFPESVHVVRFEDVIADPFATLGKICEQFSVTSAPSLKTPTWNGTELSEVNPWGTIRKATSAANRATALELSAAERDEVRARAGHYLEVFDYKYFI
jgi:hypothetical protein